MNRWFPLFLGGLATIGCQAQKPAPQASPSVLDVTPAQTPVVSANAHSSTYAPPLATTPYMLPSETPPQPIPAVEPATPPAAIPAAANAPATASKYTVKKGDTLYHIAREKYGDGKQWKRIVAANPGISPNSLKVGQILVMP